MKCILIAAMLASAASAAVPDRKVSVVVNRDGEPIVVGSGKVIRARRTLSPFTKIWSDGPVQIDLVVGKTFGAEVEADDNIIDQVVTRVDNGTLKVSTKGSYRTAHEPVARVTMSVLDAAELIGSGGMTIDGLSGGKLVLRGEGSGGFAVRSGRVDELDLEVSGSGAADVAGLRIAHARVLLSGSGAIRFRAEKSSDIDLTGSGAVAYGGAAKPTVRVTGSGRIRQLD